MLFISPNVISSAHVHENKLGTGQMTNTQPSEQIAMSSIEEGMDFACSLLSSALARKGEASPDVASLLLNELTSYIRLRYIGETLLALEYLSVLGRSCEGLEFSRTQFWRQLQWVASQMHLTEEDLKTVELLHV